MPIVMGDTTITEAEIGATDGITAGTAVASKALIIDASKDIGTIRNLTIDGIFTDGNYTFDTSGNVSGLGTVGCGAITSTDTSAFGHIKVGDGGNIGSASDADALAISSGGLVTFSQGFAVGSDAAGDVLYHNGTSYISLAKGDDDQVLTLASGVPSWADASGGGSGGGWADDGSTVRLSTATDKVGIGTTSPMNKMQLNVSRADGDDGIMIVSSDTTITATELLGGIGFDSVDGNVPSSITEASAYIAAYAAEVHGTGDKGGDLAFGTTTINEDDDTTSHEWIRLKDDGKVGIGVTDPDSTLEVFSTSTQQKWSYDADSYATLAVADSSHVTIATGETGNFTLDVAGDIVLDSAEGNIEFKDAGYIQLSLDMDSTGGAQIIKLRVSGDDLVFQQFDGTELLRLKDEGQVEVKDDLSLKSDSSILKFGASEEITLTHVHNKGLTLKHTATGDNKPIILTLATGETSIAINEVVGTINFQAPDEASGSPGTLVCAGIEAVAENTFSNSANPTKLSFKTAASDTAAETMSLSSVGVLTVSGDVVVAGGDITLQDGGSLKETGGITAFTFDGSGHVTKIGQDSPSNGEFLSWDGSKAVWAAATVTELMANDLTAGDDVVSLSTASGNITVDSNAGSVTVDGHTGITLQSTNSGDITLDSVGDVIIDANGGEILFKDDGVVWMTFNVDGTDDEIEVVGDLIFDVGGDITLDALGGQIYLKDNNVEYFRFNLDASPEIVVAGQFTIVCSSDIILSADGDQIKMDDGTSTRFTFNLDSTPELDVSGAFTIDCSSTITLDADGDQIMFKFGGATGSPELEFGHENSGDFVIQNKVDSKDIVFKDHGDAECLRVLDAAVGINVPGEVRTTGLAFTDGDDALTIADGGAITFSQTAKFADDKTLIFGTNDDWTIEYDEDGDDDLVMTGTTLNIVADTATFTSANANDPLVVIKNTTNDTNGAILRLVKVKGAAGAANDVNGLIQFYGDDASQDSVQFAEIKSQVKVHTNGEEGGKFTISVAEHDGTPTAGLVIEDGSEDGELDVTIGAGVASITSVPGNLHLTGDNTELRFYEGANYIGFEAPALSGNQIYVLPAADGSSGQQLTTNGDGSLSWAAAGSGGGGGGGGAVSAVANGVDNRVATFSSSDALNGEANFTYDGTTIHLNDNVKTGGGVNHTVATAKTSTATLSVDEHIIPVNASGGAFTLNLPAASGIGGTIFVIKEAAGSANTVTIDGDSSETIDGQTTYTMSTPYASITIYCDGSNWFVT